MSVKVLIDRDYCDAAEQVNCEPAMIKALAEVESSGSGFDKSGRLKLRFEGHKFRGYTNKIYDRTHPGISYPYSHTSSKSHGYTAFNEAFTLNPTAALLSTSWGAFQVMGFNYGDAGFETVHEMVDAYRTGEAAQLKSFITLISNWGLADEMRRATRRDCEVIAKVYNGAKYKQWGYDTKLYTALVKWRRKGIDCSKPETKEDAPCIQPSASPPAKTESQNPPSGRPLESGWRKWLKWW